MSPILNGGKYEMGYDKGRATREYERIDIFILIEELERLIAEEGEFVRPWEQVKSRIRQKLEIYRRGWTAILEHRLSPDDFDGRLGARGNDASELLHA